MRSTGCVYLGERTRYLESVISMMSAPQFGATVCVTVSARAFTGCGSATLRCSRGWSVVARLLLVRGLSGRRVGRVCWLHVPHIHVNCPGMSGDFIRWKDEVHGTSLEVPR